MTFANEVRMSAAMTSQKRMGFPTGDIKQRFIDLATEGCKMSAATNGVKKAASLT